MKFVFTVTVNASHLDGYSGKVECSQRPNGFDAVAAIRLLVEETARLTRNSPERILALVEKQTVAFSADLPVIT